MKTEAELSKITGLTREYLKRMRLSGKLKQGVHYFKLSERTIMYDDNAFFEYIKAKNENIHEGVKDLGYLVSRWKANKKSNRANGYKGEQKAS